MDDGFDSNVKEEPKNQFYAREGAYKLVTHADYSRGGRAGYNSSSISCNFPVRISLKHQNQSVSGKICYNYGRELFVYDFRGVKKLSSGDCSSKPLYQRPYKSFSPTCHQFCSEGGGSSCSLLVGFSGGQVQLLDLLRKDVDRIFNEEQLWDKSRVTCVAWVPGCGHQFVAAHASGAIYVYSTRVTPTLPTAPVFHTVSRGPGFSVHSSGGRGQTSPGRNPQQRWTVGEGGAPAAVNRLSFSPCGRRLAVVGADGWLRVLDWCAARLVGAARSYFGALTCVAWSPDGRYVAVGGEDDLVTVWSLSERRVTLRGRGHRSWVADVAFDPVMSTLPPGEGEESSPLPPDVIYRLGSVGQDTQLCLWDLSADLLRPTPLHKHRISLVTSSSPTPLDLLDPPDSSPPTPTPLSLSVARFWPLRLSSGSSARRKQTGGPKLSPQTDPSGSAGSSGTEVQGTEVGTASCPRLAECPMVEPHVSCRVSQERLTALVFLTDCLVTSCSDGYVCTWARPPSVSSGSCNNVGGSSSNGTVV